MRRPITCGKNPAKPYPPSTDHDQPLEAGDVGILVPRLINLFPELSNREIDAMCLVDLTAPDNRLARLLATLS
jgi:glycine/D-amino acid oxidase-like deaminating enzyme